jgi:predicted  nucleic acid-binding Zn-ribbon protein
MSQIIGVMIGSAVIFAGSLVYLTNNNMTDADRERLKDSFNMSGDVANTFKTTFGAVAKAGNISGIVSSLGVNAEAMASGFAKKLVDEREKSKKLAAQLEDAKEKEKEKEKAVAAAAPTPPGPDARAAEELAVAKKQVAAEHQKAEQLSADLDSARSALQRVEQDLKQKNADIDQQRSKAAAAAAAEAARFTVSDAVQKQHEKDTEKLKKQLAEETVALAKAKEKAKHVADLEEAQRELQLQVEKMTGQIALNEAVISEKNARVAELEGELKRLEDAHSIEKLQLQQDAAGSLALASKEMQEILKTKEGEIAEQLEALNTTQSKLDALETENDKIQAEITRLHESSTLSTTQNDAEVQDLKKTIGNLKSKDIVNTSTIDQLQAQLNSLVEAGIKLEKDHVSLISENEQKLHANNERMQQLNQEKTDMEARLNVEVGRLTAQNTELASDLATLRQELDIIQRELAKKEESLATANKRLEDLQKEVDLNSEARTVLENEIKKLGTILSTQTGENGSIAQQLKQRESELASLEITLAANERQIDTLQDEKTRLESALKAKEDEVTRIQQSLRDKEAELNSNQLLATNIGQQHSKEIEECNKELAKIKAELEGEKVNTARKLAEDIITLFHGINGSPTNINEIPPNKINDYEEMLKVIKTAIGSTSSTPHKYTDLVEFAQTNLATTKATPMKKGGGKIAASPKPPPPQPENKKSILQLLKNTFSGFVEKWYEEVKELIYNPVYIQLMSLSEGYIDGYITKQFQTPDAQSKMKQLIILTSYWDVHDIYTDIVAYTESNLRTTTMAEFKETIDLTPQPFKDQKHVYIYYFMDYVIELNKLLHLATFDLSNFTMYVNIYCKIINHHKEWLNLKPALQRMMTFISTPTASGVNEATRLYGLYMVPPRDGEGDDTQYVNPIKTVIRVRCDVKGEERKNITHDIRHGNINLSESNVIQVRENIRNEAEDKLYTDRYVFGPFMNVFGPDTTTTDIVNGIEIIKDLQNNQSVLLMGIGASGAGKTSTLIWRKYTDEEKSKNGTTADGEKGILLQVLDTIDNFETVTISAVELWQTTSDHSSDKTLEVVEAKKGHNMVKRVYETSTFNRSDTSAIVKNCIDIIDTNRRVAPTTNNDQSSRSHVLLFVKLGDTGTSIIIADLAGVENKFLCDDYKTIQRFFSLTMKGETEDYYAKGKTPRSLTIGSQSITKVEELVGIVERLNDAVRRINEKNPQILKNYEDLYPPALGNFTSVTDKSIVDCIKLALKYYQTRTQDEPPESKKLIPGELDSVLKVMNDLPKILPRTSSPSEFYNTFTTRFLILPLLLYYGIVTRPNHDININNSSPYVLPMGMYKKKTYGFAKDFAKHTKYTINSTDKPKLMPIGKLIRIKETLEGSHIKDVILHDQQILENYSAMGSQSRHVNIYNEIKHLLLNPQDNLTDKQRILKNIEDTQTQIEGYLKVVKEVQDGCKERVVEGAFINNELNNFRQSVSSILNLTQPDTVFGRFPIFTQECLPKYCNARLVKTNDSHNNAKSEIVKQIKAHTGDAKLKVVIVGVVNLKVNSPENPNLPYINLDTKIDGKKTILDVYEQFHEFYKANCYSTDPTDIKALDEAKYNSLKTETCKFLEKAHDYFLEKIQEHNKSSDPTKPGPLESYITDLKNCYDSIEENAENLRPSDIWSYINSIQTLNSVSIIGTIEFVDQISKRNVPQIPCHYPISEPDMYSQKIVKGGAPPPMLALPPSADPVRISPGVMLSSTVEAQSLIDHIRMYDLPMYITKAARIGLYKSFNPIEHTHKPNWMLFVYDIVMSIVVVLLFSALTGGRIDPEILKYIFIDLCISMTIILFGFVVATELDEAMLDHYGTFITYTILCPFYLIADM